MKTKILVNFQICISVSLKQETEKKKTNVHDTASELYNELLKTYYDEYFYLSHAKSKKLDRKYKPKKYLLKDMIIMCGQKIKKNQLMKKNQLIKKN